MRNIEVMIKGILLTAFFVPCFAFPIKGQIGDRNAEEDTVQMSSQTPEPSVIARFVPDSIAIGDQFFLEVEVDKDVMQLIGFPEFHNNKLGDIIEILAESPIDTLKHEGRKVILRKRYLLQTFEDGWYSIGRFPMLFADKNIVDTIWSVDSLKIKIGTFQIDTVNQTIYDIKLPMKAPMKFGEISSYILWGLCGLALICLFVWYIYTRKKNLSLLGKPKPVLPPHVVAIKELENLHNQKLWQNSKHKLYYTRLTDILRLYLEGRYGIHAMEMTTEEIVDAMTDAGLTAKNHHDLKDVLQTSDLVKFAKFVPEKDYNENAYTNAYYFVENTKPTEIETVIQQDEQNSYDK